MPVVPQWLANREVAFLMEKSNGQKMITAQAAAATIRELEFSHVVWIPDTLFGQWEKALLELPLHLIRVCREGEAWPLAAGLWAGGARPLIIMQTTGLF